MRNYLKELEQRKFNPPQLQNTTIIHDDVNRYHSLDSSLKRKSILSNLKSPSHTNSNSFDRRKQSAKKSSTFTNR